VTAGSDWWDWSELAMPPSTHVTAITDFWAEWLHVSEVAMPFGACGPFSSTEGLDFPNEIGPVT
jgi:hypothetical protein